MFQIVQLKCEKILKKHKIKRLLLSLPIYSLLLIGTIVFIHPQLSLASFEDIGASARATALGSAFTAVADDASTLYYNPAGLLSLRRKELSATYGILHAGLGDKSKINNSYVAYGQPLNPKIGAMGFSWHQLNLDNLYSERILTLGYARKITRKWTLGLNFKQLYRSFTSPVGRTSNVAITDTSQSDPVFSGGSSQAKWAFDMGYLFKPYKNYSFGLCAQNMNEPDLAISANDSDPVRMTIRGGVAYIERRMSIIGDIQTKKSFGNKRDVFFTTAAEKWWHGVFLGNADLAARSSVAFGSRDFSQVTFGLSYRLTVLQIDYGFLMSLTGLTLGDSQGNHRITFAMRFGKTQITPEEEAESLRYAAEQAARQAEAEVEAARKESERLLRELEKIKKDSADEIEKLKQESLQWKDEAQKTRQQSGEAAAVKQLDARISESMNKYWNRKFSGATISERIAILTQIVKEFSGTGTDLSSVEKELAGAKFDWSRAEDDLEVSWNYYNKIAARGATDSERIRLISRLIERFARTGLDLSNLRNELNSLKTQKE